jgi:diaminopimelate epimerase
MKPIIYDAHACHNTFIIVNCIHQSILNGDDLEVIHQRLIQSGYDDAIVLINGMQETEGFSIEMLVYGADQKFGDFCGNGARACAAFLFQVYTQYQRFFLRVNGKKKEFINHGNDRYSIELPSVNFTPHQKFFTKNIKFSSDNAGFYINYANKKLYYSDAIEPHLLLNECLSLDEITSLGEQLNQDELLFPQGINLTVFSQKDNEVLSAITFERGIMSVTKSCGTGSCCVASFDLHGMPGKRIIHNLGGILEIENKQQGVLLKGHAFVEGI